MSRQGLEDFDEEARRLIARLGRDGKSSQFSPLDAVWKHEATGAKVFIGNIQAAQSKPILAEHGVSCVVNCQDPSSQNFHEADPEFSYRRFPVAHWYRAGLDSDEAVLEFFRPMASEPAAGPAFWFGRLWSRARRPDPVFSG